MFASLRSRQEASTTVEVPDPAASALVFVTLRRGQKRYKTAIFKL
jgi:hypothetical protein